MNDCKTDVRDMLATMPRSEKRRAIVAANLM
ncbi:hypothetical protein BPC006_I0198 [Burkholderia pseudomallei BPC006]|nr:hypothetical protein BPC006_I0198 [Burkholderia pseudomallei BPC006]